jgi:hypothetical protein
MSVLKGCVSFYKNNKRKKNHNELPSPPKKKQLIFFDNIKKNELLFILKLFLLFTTFQSRWHYRHRHHCK